jgi:hypothetical protein
MTKYLILLVIAVLGIVMFSCKEPEEVETPPTTEEALNALTEYALVNKLYADAFSETDDAAKHTDEQIDGAKNGTKDTYPEITITPFDAVTWPKNVTVNYGPTNFLCQDGRQRRGTINFETTGFYREEGTVVTITFDNYYQNDHKVEGTQVVTNTGRNADNNYVYTVEITDGVVTTPQNKVINYEESTTREWAEGEPTILDVCDDVYYVTGTQNGVSSDSIAYQLTVQQQLDVKVCCEWIRGGILDVDIEGLSTITINYGDGTCDNDAVISIMGAEYPIEM